MFRDFWGTDGWYVNHVLGCRDCWGNLSSITADQIERIVIEFLRYYKVQYTHRIDRKGLRETLMDLVEHSEILTGRSLLDLNLDEEVQVKGGMTTWMHGIIKETYEDLCSVHGIGSTSASKILHGINPKVFMMWDQYIRPGYGYYKEDADDYLKFFLDCQKIASGIIKEYTKKHNCDASTAEKAICEKAYPDFKVKKPIAKLLDEYNWMKFCNERDLPDPWLDP